MPNLFHRSHKPPAVNGSKTSCPIPSMTSPENNPKAVPRKAARAVRNWQVGSFLLGIGFMYLVAELEAMEETKSSDAVGVQSHNEL